MSDKQVEQLRQLYFTTRAYLNEQDVEDANVLYCEIENLIADITKWIK